MDYYESYDNHSHSKSTVLTSDGNKSLNQNINHSNNRNFSTLAYGIRNSSGLAVDPLTGNLWDTENGENTTMRSILLKPDSTVDGCKLWVLSIEIPTKHKMI